MKSYPETLKAYCFYLALYIDKWPSPQSLWKYLSTWDGDFKGSACRWCVLSKQIKPANWPSARPAVGFLFDAVLWGAASAAASFLVYSCSTNQFQRSFLVNFSKFPKKLLKSPNSRCFFFKLKPDFILQCQDFLIIYRLQVSSGYWYCFPVCSIFSENSESRKAATCSRIDNKSIFINHIRQD